MEISFTGFKVLFQLCKDPLTSINTSKFTVAEIYTKAKRKEMKWNEIKLKEMKWKNIVEKLSSMGTVTKDCSARLAIETNYSKFFMLG